MKILTEEEQNDEAGRAIVGCDAFQSIANTKQCFFVLTQCYIQTQEAYIRALNFLQSPDDGLEAGT
jgi:hypothetical protein